MYHTYTRTHVHTHTRARAHKHTHSMYNVCMMYGGGISWKVLLGSPRSGLCQSSHTPATKKKCKQIKKMTFWMIWNLERIFEQGESAHSSWVSVSSSFQAKTAKTSTHQPNQRRLTQQLGLLPVTHCCDRWTRGDSVHVCTTVLNIYLVFTKSFMTHKLGLDLQTVTKLKRPCQS